jgi:murein DD-endopeptidase MepM/ murein hydrolase activator NlpD
MTSPFGLRWSGVLPRIHHGVDINVPEGTPVRAMASGRVRYAGWMSGFGNVIWLEHRGNTLSVYAHLSRIDVRAGDGISGQQVIGHSGSTGNVSGPHLHFEVWVSGRPVDPVPFLGRRSPVVRRAP